MSFFRSIRSAIDVFRGLAGDAASVVRLGLRFRAALSAENFSFANSWRSIKNADPTTVTDKCCSALAGLLVAIL
jgi:hypothetical protein